MSTESRLRYAIDAQDRISFIDEGWCRFAEANDGRELMPPAVLGQSLWDCISDETTRALYRQIISRVRRGRSARFTLRCDGPAHRRLLEMTMRPASDGSVEFETQILNVADREPVALLERRVERSSDLLRACAWCSRVDVGFASDDWVEVEDAARRLRLFEAERMPRVTHSICGPCLDSMTDTLEEMERNSGESSWKGT